METGAVSCAIMDAAARDIAGLRKRADLVLDATGLDCPLPVLRARAQLNEMPAGQTLLVLATDPHSAVDFRAFAARTGTPILAQGADGETWFFLLEKPRGLPKT